MKAKNILFAVLCALLFSCNGRLGDSEMRQKVEKDFQERRSSFQATDYFNVFEQELDTDTRFCLQFLYAYMPLPDLTDYSSDFHLSAVRQALQCRKEMPWGNRIPDREFLHFVLPIRVNNEHLDSARQIFYTELKKRVQNLSMADAILEVNHWCHEKAVYQPSDGRTSSPLATVKTAFGRCGEESTLLVAALRSVGIPARQVYTPRWAHTDDNHAWVEAWADGKWHFLGACEPEPVLDLGWFNSSASRGMLMHTKVFGDYNGFEEVMSRNACFTEINLIENYAPTASVSVQVVDGNESPVKNADVEFKLYNYGEFYTVAHKVSDEEGKTVLTAGLGDMLVWVSKDGHSAYRKVSFGKDKEVRLVLPASSMTVKAENLDFVPPAENGSLPEVTSEQRAANTRRMATEDSLRNAYIATFPTVADAADFARQQGLDEQAVTELLAASRGNYRVLMDFIERQTDKVQALKLIHTLSRKDWRDVTSDILEDHFGNVASSSDFTYRYVDCPRVANEHLTPYRAVLSKAFNEAETNRFRREPQDLASWCVQNIRIDSVWNPQGLFMSPLSVWKLRMTDRNSLNAFFVALARSLDIPARLNPVDGKPEFFRANTWQRAVLEKQTVESAVSMGNVVLDLTDEFNNDPKYYTHFTLSRLVNGQLQLLTYPDEAPWSATFKNSTPLEVGDYLLTTGTRLANGSVLAHLEFFRVNAGQTIHVPLTMRHDDEALQVIGHFNSENLYFDEKQRQQTSILKTTGRGYYAIALVASNHEPTNHMLRDLSARKTQLETWGRPILLICENEEKLHNFNRSEFSSLPSTVVWGADLDGKIRAEIFETMNADAASLPILLIADTFNRIVYCSKGYTIGSGEKLVKAAQQTE